MSSTGSRGAVTTGGGLGVAENAWSAWRQRFLVRSPTGASASNGFSSSLSGKKQGMRGAGALGLSTLAMGSLISAFASLNCS